MVSKLTKQQRANVKRWQEEELRMKRKLEFFKARKKEIKAHIRYLGGKIKKNATIQDLVQLLGELEVSSCVK